MLLSDILEIKDHPTQVGQWSAAEQRIINNIFSPWKTCTNVTTASRVNTERNNDPSACGASISDVTSDDAGVRTARVSPLRPWFLSLHIFKERQSENKWSQSPVWNHVVFNILYFTFSSFTNTFTQHGGEQNMWSRENSPTLDCIIGSGWEKQNGARKGETLPISDSRLCLQEYLGPESHRFGHSRLDFRL